MIEVIGIGHPEYYVAVALAQDGRGKLDRPLGDKAEGYVELPAFPGYCAEDAPGYGMLPAGLLRDELMGLLNNKEAWRYYPVLPGIEQLPGEICHDDLLLPQVGGL